MAMLDSLFDIERCRLSLRHGVPVLLSEHLSLELRVWFIRLVNSNER